MADDHRRWGRDDDPGRPADHPRNPNNPDSDNVHRDRNPDNEITVPNIFGGPVSRDDPSGILRGLIAGSGATRDDARPPYGEPERPRPEPTRYRPMVSPPVAATMLPERRRRRNAMLGVLVVVGLTVAVVAAALVIAPRWSGNAQPEPTPTTAPYTDDPNDLTSGPDNEPTPSAPTATSPPAVSSAPASTTAPTAKSAVPPPKTVTRTVTTAPEATKSTAAKSTSTAAKPTKTTPKATTTPKPTKTSPKPKKPTPKPTKPTPTPKPENVLGVPRKDIACDPGYVVQLASELDAATFTARVKTLKAQGMVPADAKAADSRSSCAIFANQTNTLVLYVGPYAEPYRGCAARLMGPADGFIKGANPDNARQYVSCICPAQVASLPKLGPDSTEHGWIGELQRSLANRLNISVGPLGAGQWGVYTAGTQNAVKQFQSSQKLPATGTMDAATWQKLQGAQC